MTCFDWCYLTFINYLAWREPHFSAGLYLMLWVIWFLKKEKEDEV
jgi:hypothetical protein